MKTRNPWLLPAVAIAAVFGLGAVSAETDLGPAPETEDNVIVNFLDDGIDWRIVNDGVMGGLSSSDISAEDGIAVFEGSVSLDNNGGFASMRSAPIEHDFSQYFGLRLRVKGDGQRYDFRIRTSRNFDGPSYRVSFETKIDEWTEVELPFENFLPAFRGRTLREYPALDPAAIETLGILIADKQEGAFRIEIDWIQGVKTE